MAEAWATLRITDLDHTAKMARLVLACHAEHPDTKATLTVEAIAADLGLSYGTTWRALQRAVKAGYLAVENPAQKHPGKLRTWSLTSRADARPSSRESATEFARTQPKGRTPARDVLLKKKKDLKKEGAPSLAHRKAASNGAVDKHPDSCRCGGTGWVAVAGGTTVTQCLEAAK